MSRLVRYAVTQELLSRKGCAFELKVFKLKIQIDWTNTLSMVPHTNVMKLNKLRTSIQMLWLLFLNSTLPLNFFDFPAKLLCVSVGFHLMPLGGVTDFFALRRFPFHVAGELGIAGMLSGGLSCGWACPFGFFQDFLYKLPTKKFELDFKFAEALRFRASGAHDLFAVRSRDRKNAALLQVVSGGRLGSGAVVIAEPSLRRRVGILFCLKLAVLLMFVFLSTVSKRHSAALHPLGAILSAFNPLSSVRLEVDDGCVRCRRCEAAYPTLKVYEMPNSTRCIRCLECLDACEGEHIHVYFGLTQRI